jgi:hypothetical protein
MEDGAWCREFVTGARRRRRAVSCRRWAAPPWSGRGHPRPPHRRRKSGPSVYAQSRGRGRPRDRWPRAPGFAGKALGSSAPAPVRGPGRTHRNCARRASWPSGRDPGTCRQARIGLGVITAAGRGGRSSNQGRSCPQDGDPRGRWRGGTLAPGRARRRPSCAIQSVD